MSNDRTPLTYDQAVAMLPEGETIHTFRNTCGMLIGADWSREQILEAIRNGKPELAGETASSMNHGLVVWAPLAGPYTLPLFVETRKDGA